MGDLKKWVKDNLSSEDVEQLLLRRVTPDQLQQALSQYDEFEVIKRIKELKTLGPIKISDDVGYIAPTDGEKGGDIFLGLNPYRDGTEKGTVPVETKFNIASDPLTTWTIQDGPLGNRYISEYGEVADPIQYFTYDGGTINQGYDDSGVLNAPGNLYDAAVNLSNQYYNNPFLGALARHQAAWDNGSDPVKAIFHNTPVMFTPQGLVVNAITGLFGDEGFKKTNRILQDLDNATNKTEESDAHLRLLASGTGDVLNAAVLAPLAVKPAYEITKKGFDKVLLSPQFEKMLTSAYGEEKAWEMSDKIKNLAMRKWYLDNPGSAQELSNFFRNTNAQQTALYEAIKESIREELGATAFKNTAPEALSKMIYDKMSKYHLVRGRLSGPGGSSVHLQINDNNMHIDLLPGNNQQLDPVMQRFAKNIEKMAPKGTSIQAADYKTLGRRMALDPMLEYDRTARSYEVIDPFNYNISSATLANKKGLKSDFIVTYPGTSMSYNSLNASEIAFSPKYKDVRPAIMKEIYKQLQRNNPQAAHTLRIKGYDPSLTAEEIDVLLNSLTPQDLDTFSYMLESIATDPTQYPQVLEALKKSKEFANLPAIQDATGQWILKYPIATKIDKSSLSPTDGYLDYFNQQYVRDTPLNDLYKASKEWIDWFKP